MAVPGAYVIRSYGGGAEPAQLVESIGTSDLSFAITTTAGWTEADGSPLGTVGPFCVIIDRFTSTVEKIICTAVNLTSGVVTVDAGGRGADGTTPQGHVPDGSVSGVQTTWTSVEAAEANEGAAILKGTAAGTPANGDVLSFESGAPLWQSPSAVSGISLFGVGGALTGGTPPARDSGGFLIQAGSTPVATGGTGGFTINFPVTFPSGLLTIYGHHRGQPERRQLPGGDQHGQLHHQPVPGDLPGAPTARPTPAPRSGSTG